jgi:hypothetical protein
VIAATVATKIGRKRVTGSSGAAVRFDLLEQGNGRNGFCRRTANQQEARLNPEYKDDDKPRYQARFPILKRRG